MDPKEYERLAPFEELDREHDESERAVAETFERGQFDETGGSLGWDDPGPPDE